MREFNFTKYFTYLLYDHNQVAVPGLGIFKLERVNSFQQAGENVIYPPSYSIRFQEDKNLVLDDSFLKKLRLYYPRLQKQEYLDFSNEFIKALELNSKVYLSGIGEIYIKDDKLFFEEDKHTTSLLTNHLPKLNLKFFTKGLPILSWLDMKLASMPHKLWTYFLPIILVILLGISLLTFDIPSLKINKNITSEPPKPKTELPNYKKDTVHAIKDEIDSLLSNTGGINIDSIGISSNGEVIKRCIIITGAYRSNKYKNLMIDKIKSLGYKVFTQDVKGLIRVGIEFDCTDSTLPEMLRTIRNTIDKEAWHLEEKEG